MANTITVSLSLSSSNVLPSPMNVSVGTNISADSGTLTRAKVLSTSADGSTATLRLYEANDKLERAYLFVRNLDSELENYIYIHNEAVDNNDFAKIGGGRLVSSETFILTQDKRDATRATVRLTPDDRPDQRTNAAGEAYIGTTSLTATPPSTDTSTTTTTSTGTSTGGGGGGSSSSGSSPSTGGGY